MIYNNPAAWLVDSGDIVRLNGVLYKNTFGSRVVFRAKVNSSISVTLIIICIGLLIFSSFSLGSSRGIDSGMKSDHLSINLPQEDNKSYDTSYSTDHLSSFIVPIFSNPYRDGSFNPGDKDRDGVEDILETEIGGRSPGDMIECYLIYGESSKDYSWDLLDEMGVHVKAELDNIGQLHVLAPAGVISHLPSIEGIVEVCQVPIMEKYLDSSINAMNVDQVHNLGYSGQGSTIAILDTGIDGNHEAFPGNKILAFRDFTTWPPQNTAAYDDDGHGTHCASISAGDPPAGGASGGRYGGVAPEADLLIARVMGASVMGYVVNAVDWVVSVRNTYDVEVMSLSIGTVNQQGLPIHSDSMNSAVNDAISYGIVVCAAGGNDGEQGYSMGSPADAQNVVTVGSSNDYGGVSSFSTRGPGENNVIKPDILAPGQSIIAARAQGTDMGGGGWEMGVSDPTHYVGAQGTSMSCPHVAGAVAILREANPTTTPADIKTALRASAPYTNSPNNDRGCGMMDAKKALDLIGNAPEINSITANGQSVLGGNVPKVDEDETVTFTASASDDGALGDSAYGWDFDDDGNADITGRSVTHSYPNNGMWTGSLTVTDTDNFRVRMVFNIEVLNVVPTIAITSTNTVSEGSEMHFTAIISDSASDLDSLVWYWDFDSATDLKQGDGQWVDDGITDNDRMAQGTGSNAQGYHTYQGGASKTLIIVVWDDDQEYASETESITISNIKPQADFSIGEGGPYFFEDEDILFDASASTDTPGDMATLEYRWDFNDGHEVDWSGDDTAYHKFAQQGTYSVELEVKDNDGSVDKEILQVDIRNWEPLAVINPLEDSYSEGEDIVLTGTNSSDTISDIPSLKYYWDTDTLEDAPDDGDVTTDWDDDGITDNDRELEGGVVSFPYDDDGYYNISLIVVDNDGASDISLGELFIKNSPPRDLTAEAFVNGERFNSSLTVNEGETVLFRGSAMDVIGDLHELNFTWDFADGTGPLHGDEVEHAFHFQTSQPYNVQLTARDYTHSSTEAATLSVSVVNVAPTLELGRDRNLKDNGTIRVEPDVKDSPQDLNKMKYFWFVIESGQSVDFGNPTYTGNMVFVHEFLIDGEYEIHLRIEDDNGQTALDSIEVSAEDIDPDGDYDSDGIPNAYEIKKGFNPRISDSHLDADKDGYSNLEEYKKGSDPKNAGSVPKDTLGEGLSGFMDGISTWLWWVISAVILIFLILLVVVMVVRRRRMNKRLAKAFKGDMYEKDGTTSVDNKGGKKGKHDNQKGSYDYLGDEMGLGTKDDGRKKDDSSLYDDLPEESSSLDYSDSEYYGGTEKQVAYYDPDDAVYHEEVDYFLTETIVEHDAEKPVFHESTFSLESSDTLTYTLPGDIKDHSDDTSDQFDHTDHGPDEDDHYDESTTDKPSRLDLDDLFNLSLKDKNKSASRSGSKVERKEHGAGKERQSMSPIKRSGSRPSMKPLSRKGVGSSGRPTMKPTMKPVGKGSLSNVDKPEPQYNAKDVDRLLGGDMKTVLGSQGGIGRSGAGRSGEDQGVEDGKVCGNCGTPAKKGWWICPQCKKKL